MSVIEKIQNQVAAGQLDEALEETARLLKSQGGTRFADVQNLQSQLAQLNRRVRNNMIRYDDAAIERSKISMPLLDMLEEMRKEVGIEIKVLMLQANPFDTTRLRIDRELRDIQEELRRSNERDRFQLKIAPAVTLKSMQQALLDQSPNIVHFSGHGLGTAKTECTETDTRTLSFKKQGQPTAPAEEGIVIEDQNGNQFVLGADKLGGLFSLCSDTVQCVLLNSCFSHQQAEAIRQHIPFVIGMSRAVPDETAIQFAVHFYQALGAGKDYEKAFQVSSEFIRGLPGSEIPQLMKRD